MILFEDSIIQIYGVAMNYGLLKKYTREISVLFVEDDSIFREEFSEFIRDIFSHVDVAKNGEEALVYYHNYYKKTSKYYDLLISDIKMPYLNGTELINRVYSINKNQIVIVLSARDEFSYMLPLINLGINHFFPKPFEYEIFIEEIFNITSKIYTNKKQKIYTNPSIIKIHENIIWDKTLKELFKNKERVSLTRKEILLIDKMLGDKGRIYTLSEIFYTLWDGDFDTNAKTDNLKNIVARLKRKVPELNIKSLYGVGYKLERE